MNMSEKTCGNCQHWSGEKTFITNTHGQTFKAGTCGVNAHDVDAPQFAVMLGEDSNCLNALDGCQFEPSRCYLDWLADANAYANPAEYNGVTQGLHFPASM